jgi:hypothetical protein
MESGLARPEMTDEMLRAGHEAYAGYFLDLMRGEDCSKLMVRDVFLAMLAARPKSS